MSDIQLWWGDSRELAASIPDKSIKCLILDPPYGKNFRSHRATTPQGMKHTQLIEGDASPEQAIWLFAEVMQALEPKVAVECDAYLFTSWDLVDTWIEVARSMTAHQFIYKMLLIWEKGYPGQGDIDGNWGCGHEEILYLKRGRRDMPYRRSGVIHVDKLSAKKHIHPTEKPVQLMEELIRISTEPGDLVVDPFAGSASSLMAARNLGRNAIGIELSSEYVRLAQERLAEGVLL